MEEYVKVGDQTQDLIGQQFQVLDDGFVRVVDVMGGDTSIVQAARISYGAGTKHLSEDRSLIRYLLRHRHTTPFEMCELKLHLRVPMDCWRQWIRHRTANVNEYSTRYSEAIDAAQRTSPSEWRRQATANKQGSAEFLGCDVGETLSRREEELQALSRQVYEERLAAGVAREQARKDLPLSTYTEAYWKIDLHNLLHFLSLRMDSLAQREIRAYASVIGHNIVSRWCPLTWGAFVDYRLNSLSLSGVEIEVINRLATGDPAGARNVLIECGMLVTSNESVKRNRERDELEGKLLRLGFAIPWRTPDNEGSV